MKIREATVFELETCRELYADMCRELTPLGHDVLQPKLLYDSLEKLVIVAVEGDDDAEEIIGCSIFGMLANDNAMGLGTYVKPEHRRKHVATKLREKAITTCTMRGCLRMWGNALLTNEAGIASALAAGFKKHSIMFVLELNPPPEQP